MNNVFLTGSNGFLGSHLQSFLNKLNVNILKLPGSDLSNVQTLKQFLNKDIDFVFHLGGKTFVPDSWQNPHDFFMANTLGTQNVLDFCRTKSIGLHYVSAYIYGIQEQMPIEEAREPKPNNPYALSKYLSEQLCEFYAENFNLNISVSRPFNIYGSGQSEKFLIPKIIQDAIKKGEVNLGSLTPKRDYIHVDDVCRAIIKIAQKSKKFSVYNIGSGKSISGHELVKMILSILGKDINVKSSSEERKNEILNVEADISRIVSEIGWSPEYNLEEGLRKTIADFKSEWGL
jgi:nucleoside-diphosphate-sugar epimerase